MSQKRKVVFWQRPVFRLHFFCWVIFIVYEIVISGLFVGYFSPLLSYVVSYSFYIALFYFNGAFVLPFGERVKRFRVAAILALISTELIFFTFMFISVKLKLSNAFYLNQNLEVGFNSHYIVGVIYRLIYFILLSTGYFFIKRYLYQLRAEMRRRLKIKQLEYQVIRTQASLLRAQINPHLLFNTLNFIKYAIKRAPDDADIAIDCLSKLLQFSSNDYHKDTVDLKSELEQVDNLIQLNNLRFNGNIHVQLKNSTKGSLSIIPMVLLTLVENIFKHGKLDDPRYPALIEIRGDKQKIIFKTCNRIQENVKHSRTGTGLDNIRSRLMIKYPKNYIFNYRINNNWFESYLEIQTV